MKSWNDRFHQTHIVVICIVLLAGIGFSRSESFWANVVMILGIIPLVTLIAWSNFFQTRISRIAMLGIALTIFGALFKIMHWPWTAHLLLSGMGLILLSYVVYYFSKPMRIFLDHVKLIFAFCFILGKLFRLFHWPFGYEISVVGDVALLLAFALLILREIKLYKLEKRKDQSE